MSDIYERHTAYCNKHYPQITEQYLSFLNNTRPSDLPLLSFSEELTTEAIEEAYNELERGRVNAAYDALTMCAGVYEHSAFIIGFMAAMRYMRESFGTTGGIKI